MTGTPKRRQLHFESTGEILAEAERLASGQVETTGNYTFGQILEHLARVLDVITGHLAAPKAPLPMRIFGRMIRPFVLKRPMSPGFKLPKSVQSLFWPEEAVDAADALNHLREAIERFEKTEPLPKHPFFGNMNRDQHTQLQCRHCELHLGFVQPAEES